LRKLKKEGDQKDKDDDKDSNSDKEDKIEDLVKPKDSKYLTHLTSIYNIKNEKDKTLNLSDDSTSMGYAAFLTEEHLGFDLKNSARADVYMNSLLVHCVQIFMIFAIWNYESTATDFMIMPA
jgi:hypothetical protein